MICRTCRRVLAGDVRRTSLLSSISANNLPVPSDFSRIDCRYIRTPSKPENRPVAAEAHENVSKLSFHKFDKLLPREINVEAPRPPTSSTSFADFVNYSKTLQALLTLGVELHKIERKHPKALQYLVTLDLSRDIKPRIKFLIDLGVIREEIAPIITKNPKILSPDVKIAEIEEVIDYFKEKKFADDEIVSLAVRLPMVLTMPVADLDGILGFYQQLETNRSERKIKFSNDELRSIILRCPMLIISDLRSVFEQVRTLEVSCEFTLNEIRKLIMGYPNILIASEKHLELLYKFYLREMQITNAEMTDFPGALGSRIQVVLERHYYLQHLRRDQYKRDMPGYVPLSVLYSGSDEQFCNTLQLGQASDFRKFVKTL